MKIIVSLFFFWTVWDRLTSMFCVKSEAKCVASIFERLNSALMMCLYAVISFYGFFSMLVLSQVNGVISFTGIILYMSSRFLRNTAIGNLGNNWNIYTSAASIARISKTGPFRYTRHPYYLATWGELLGYAFLFNSWYSGVAAIVIFLPLLFGIRIAIEEKELIKRFPSEYGQYRNEVGLIFRKRRKED